MRRHLIHDIIITGINQTSQPNMKENALGSYSRVLGCNLVLNVLGYNIKLSELHGVLSSALGHTPQIAHVLEHLRQWHEGVNHLHASRLITKRVDLPTPGVKITDDITHVVFWGHHLHLNQPKCA